ncbi:adrenocortical dysplasia protein homolog isoform 1-T4 [Odontesthes bonariensis]|uniref:adrenocortical dysplasia protein homolog n=1 Tax=Odontesthes bonariensis TaxID=219752 RepID=UPI003F589145
MSRAARNRLTPWIESLILSYGGREEGEGGGAGERLKAHVIGVGQMSLSQVRGSDGPTGLLFLSDGVLQIPAVLTAAAWEHLQEQEDRECFTSLLNTTVFVQDSRLRFHMAQEQTRCRFFLSVGELATTAAGPVREKTPCCTTLPSVRMKICRTWRALLDQEGSQRSQCEFDLSELLGEWQHDCLQAVLEDVRQRLVAASTHSPQPCTSTHSPPVTRPLTSWDVDRVRYKGEKPFSVPVKFLLMPEEDSRPTQTVAGAGRGTQTAGSGTQTAGSGTQTRTESTQPPVDAPCSQMSTPAGAETVWEGVGSSPVLVEDAMISGVIDMPLSNPWDIYPPPCVTFSSSDSSREATPPHSPASSKPDSVTMETSTQLPVHSSKESGYFPPYQRQPAGLSATASASLTPSDRPPASARPPASDRPPASAQLNRGREHVDDGVQENYRKPKRKRCEATPEVTEEEEPSGSPPSWLFESQAGAFGVEEGSGPKLPGGGPRRTPNTHSDGKPLTYSYKVSGQNLQDFSRFRVAAALLHWAVRYLLAPRRTDRPEGS